MNAELKRGLTAAELGLAEAFATLRAGLSGGAVRERREAAFRSFEAQGLPHRRVEAWKYTDLRALMQEAKPLAGPPEAGAKERARTAGAMFASSSARRMVFVDGAFAPELSDVEGLEPGLNVTSLGAALARGDIGSRLGGGPAEGDVAYALNTAFLGDGAVVEVAAGARIERPLHLVFAYGAPLAAAVFTRSLVILGAASRLTLIESHEGPDGIDYQVNDATDVAVGDRARLDHVKVIADGDAALCLATLSATIGAGAEYRDLAFATGGGIVRNQLFVRCAGAGATLGLNGACMLTGRQHWDTAVLVDHSARGCASRELFKSVVDGAGRGVFQGRIIVRPGAQKTDARMMTRALLLSEDAEADSKPELEIFADDVQCGHGATCGSLDDNLKFYLMARGIPEHEAEALLIESFVGEAIETVAHEGVREALMAATRRWLATKR